MKPSLIPYLAIMVLAVALAGCHSSKTTTKPAVPTATGTGTATPGKPVTPTTTVEPAQQTVVFGTNPGDAGWQQMARRLADEAATWLGTPYKYGGQDHDGADCSGLTMQVYDNATGIKIPRNSAKQAEYCRAIDAAAVLPGDLLFFNTSGAGVSHVGMYLGNGQMVHASGSRGVVISNLYDKYYQRTYMQSGRVAALEALAAQALAPAEIRATAQYIPIARRKSRRIIAHAPAPEPERVVVDPTPEPAPAPTPIVKPEPAPIVEPEPAPVVADPEPVPIVKPEPAPIVEPEPTPAEEPEPTPEPEKAISPAAAFGKFK